MAEKMKAVGLYKYLPITEGESFLDVTLEKPVPEGHDLLVRVKAISVNPVDYKVRAPKDTVEVKPRILGWDACGIVEAVGEECTLFSPGDEVFYAGDITRPGCDSEYHLVDERIVGRKPNTLDYAESAALPLTSITAYEALFERLMISCKKEDNRGKMILIINASGGVGSIATQMAKAAGLTVIGTASRKETIEWAKAHGADYVVNHRESLKEQIEKLGYPFVDYILCLNNTDYHWKNIIETIAPLGRICSIVETEHPLDVAPLKPKSASFSWEFMFTKAMFKKDMITQHDLLDRVADYVDKGILETTLHEKKSPINAENLRQAHQELESGKTIGKIVIEGWES